MFSGDSITFGRDQAHEAGSLLMAALLCAIPRFCQRPSDHYNDGCKKPFAAVEGLVSTSKSVFRFLHPSAEIAKFVELLDRQFAMAQTLVNARRDHVVRVASAMGLHPTKLGKGIGVCVSLSRTPNGGRGRGFPIYFDVSGVVPAMTV
jgi:hypothetical protein